MANENTNVAKAKNAKSSKSKPWAYPPDDDPVVMDKFGLPKNLGAFCRWKINALQAEWEGGDRKVKSPVPESYWPQAPERMLLVDDLRAAAFVWFSHRDDVGETREHPIARIVGVKSWDLCGLKPYDAFSGLQYGLPQAISMFIAQHLPLDALKVLVRRAKRVMSTPLVQWKTDAKNQIGPPNDPNDFPQI